MKITSIAEQFRSVEVMPLDLCVPRHSLNHRIFFLFIFLIMAGSAALHAQTTLSIDTGYLKLVTARSEKIVQSLLIEDPMRAGTVTELLSLQYIHVNRIHKAFSDVASAIRQEGLSGIELEGRLRRAEAEKTGALNRQHEIFISGLRVHLDEGQMEKVRDGMTYRVMPITYAAYVDMIPRLTQEQKGRIRIWLMEARELAMDGESSEKKHAIFGKYKGRINNYLSSEGYDLKKETADWQQRLRERNNTK
jgi:hypothetical protein